LALFFVNLGVSHTKKEAFFFFCSFGQGVGQENVTKLLPFGSEKTIIFARKPLVKSPYTCEFEFERKHYDRE